MSETNVEIIFEQMTFISNKNVQDMLNKFCQKKLNLIKLYALSDVKQNERSGNISTCADKYPATDKHTYADTCMCTRTYV